MSTIYALHGIVESPQPELFRHRNMSDKSRIRALLDRRKFVPLAMALNGEGDALTIDDATVAGAQAALLIREFGHAVTLFVNPWQVEDGRAYAFSCLNALLDQADKRKIVWHGETYNFAKLPDRSRLRSTIKQIMRRHSDPEQNYALIEELRQKLDVPRIDIPDYLQSLTIAQLCELHNAGVDIQNHYWTHLDPAAHTPARFADECLRARDWLSDILKVSSQFFASPFGEYFPRQEFLSEARIVCLLLNHSHPAGDLRPGVINRLVFA